MAQGFASPVLTPANLTQIGSTSFSLGQQLAAASIPTVLTAAQITTLTPLSSVNVGNFPSGFNVNNFPADFPLPAAQITTLTPPTTVTVQQATGMNLHTVVDSGNITVPLITNFALETGGNLADVKANQTNATQKTQIVDSLGNVISSSTHNGINLLYTDVADANIVDTMTGLGDSVEMPINGMGSMLILVGGTWQGKIDIQGSIDSTWVTLSIFQPTGQLIRTGINNDAQNGMYRVVIVTAYSKVRAVFTSWTSGTATIEMNASQQVGSSQVWQLNQLNLLSTVYQPTGTNLHTVIDSGTVTVPLITNFALETGGNLATLAGGVTGSKYQIRSLTSASDSVEVKQATGTNLHTVIDSGSVNIGNFPSDYPLPAAQVTTLTPPTTVTVQQPTGTNLHTVVDSGNIVLTDEYGFDVENTPMGEMRMVEPTRLVGATFDGYVIDTNFWFTEALGSAVVSQLGSFLRLTDSTVAGSSANMRSVRRGRYVGGSSIRYRSVISQDIGLTGNTRMWGVGSIANYSFTVSVGTPAVGNIYTNNSQQFVVLQVVSPTSILCSGTGAPAASGTLTFISGPGAGNLTYTAFATAFDVIDGAYFKVVGTTFSINTIKEGSETSVTSFNGVLGSSYTLTGNVTTYEIYWTNSKVYFVIGNQLLHTVTAQSTIWSNTLSFQIFAKNTCGLNASARVMNIRTATIYRLGKPDTRPLWKQESSTVTGIVLKRGSGTLHSVVNTNNAGAITLYDAVSEVNPIAIVDCTKVLGSIPLHLDFYNGLCYTTTGNPKVTIIWE